MIEDSLKNTIKLLQKLIKVIPLSEPINKITSEDLFQWGFHSNNFNKALLESGVNTDLIILLRFLGIKEENLLKDNEFASISDKFILNENTKRPIVGVIYLNSNINLNLENINIYLQYIFLHEFTHSFHESRLLKILGGKQLAAIFDKIIKALVPKVPTKGINEIIIPTMIGAYNAIIQYQASPLISINK